MMKKTFAVLLALLLASTAVSLLTSCSKEEPGQEKTDGETENGETDSGTDPLNLEFSPNVPEGLKFEGETFSMLIGSTGQTIWAEEENSDLINDTVYRRNKLVGEHFGVTMNIVKTNAEATGDGQKEATAQFRSLIENGDTTYQAFVHVQHSGMPQMILERYFVDWNTIPYVHLEDSWWYQNILDDLCFGDKVYVMTGDYALYLDRINCLVFNKAIFDELDLDYPYQDVLDGTWTMDKFEELMKKGAKDLDGNGVMEYGTDRWGLVGWHPEMAVGFQVASGFRPLEKDAEGLPILNQNLDGVHEIYQRIVDLFADGQYAWDEVSDYSSQNKIFNEGRAMFKDIFLGGIPTILSETEFDFGILPYPKWDENAEYMARSSNMTALTYIPVTNTNLEMTGAVLEEMAFQSAKTLTPTYFDIVLTVKNTRDVESEQMLPIIKNSARFYYPGFAPEIGAMVVARNNSFSSKYASELPTYQADLEEMRRLLTEDE